MSEITSAPIKLNFLLCINRNFVLGAGTLVASIFEHNPHADINFYIFTSAEFKSRAEKYLLPRLARRFKQAAQSLHFLTYEDIQLFNKLKGQVSERILMCCLRLIVPRCLQINSDRLIYLDADMVCNGDLSELASLDLQGKALGVTSGGQRTFVTDAKHKFTVEHYFCAGFLMFNLTVWNSTDLDERCVEFVVKEHPSLSDQDALNVVCAEHIYTVDDKYQTFPANSQNGVIVHYAGGKPWTPWHFHENTNAVNLFRRCCKLFEPDVAQWISFRLEKDSLVNFNYTQARKAMKWLSKLFFKRRNYRASLYFYYLHLKIKFKQKGFLGILLLKSNTRSYKG